MSPSVAESQPRILLQGTLVVAIIHCLMKFGVNKFDDFSGASAPAKFHRKTLIDNTPCTEQNVSVHSKHLNLQSCPKSGRRNARLFAIMTALPLTRSN